MIKKKNKKNSSQVTIAETRQKIGSEIDFAANEAYKQLRTNISFTLNPKNKCNIFGVTSSIPGEGKSLTSINLALSFAQMDKKVLLIECDLRKPVFAEYFDLNVENGLIHALLGRANLNDVIYKYKDFKYFRILPVGVIPPNPAEMLATQTMVDLVESFKETFDLIILDLPPVNTVADATIVAKMTEGMLVIVSDNYVDNVDLDETVRMLKLADAKILGFSYNLASKRNQDYYYKNKYYKRKKYYKED